MSISMLFTHSVVSDSLRPHRLQHTRLSCPSLSSWVCSNSCPLSRWCHPAILCITFSTYPQPFPASGSFPVSWLFTSSGWSIGVSASASVLPMSIQGWFPLRLTGLILLPNGLSRVYTYIYISVCIYIYMYIHQSCPTLCDPMDCSMPGFPVLHYLPALAQTHVHWASGPTTHPLLPPSPAFNLPALGSFPVSWLFTSSGQSIRASA